MFELKTLHKEAIPAALERAKHYRLLNEPGAAQSICLDILQIEPNNQDALITIILAMSDRFGKDYAIGDSQIKDYLAQISDEYERAYYTGIIYERRAKASLNKKLPGSEHAAYDYFLPDESFRLSRTNTSLARKNRKRRVPSRAFFY